MCSPITAPVLGCYTRSGLANLKDVESDISRAVQLEVSNMEFKAHQWLLMANLGRLDEATQHLGAVLISNPTSEIWLLFDSVYTEYLHRKVIMELQCSVMHVHKIFRADTAISICLAQAVNCRKKLNIEIRRSFHPYSQLLLRQVDRASA